MGDRNPDDLGERIRRDVHNRIADRMEQKRLRWEAKMERRRLKWQARSYRQNPEVVCTGTGAMTKRPRFLKARSSVMLMAPSGC